MAKRKICVVTGTRAEYGLLYWLMKEIQADKELELQIIATGMHLSPEFGSTYKVIEKDGFRINAKVEMLLSGDNMAAITKFIGRGVIGFADAFQSLKPDILLILGDRYEILAAAQAAMVARIPIAHLHGGETTEGVIDEAIRHSVTKMSHWHFVANEIYRQRVIQLGEHPDRVFNYGALGLDNLKRLKLLDRKELEKSVGPMGKLNFLVTYHPVTLSKASPSSAVSELFKALDKFPEAKVIITKPNSDTDSRVICRMIDDYASRNPKRVMAATSLGQLLYLSTLKQADIVIGNSSSGLIEAPVLRKPTVNMGDRQKGRLRASSVIDCGETAPAISAAIRKALSPDFQKSLRNVISLYGEPDASRRIKNQLKKVNLEGILMKSFFDLPSRGPENHAGESRAKKKVIVVAPHPDDETIGCGGALLKHKARKDSIHWLIVTTASQEAGYTKAQQKAQNRQVEKVASIYKFDGVHRLNFSTTRLDSIPMANIIAAMAEVFKKVKPEIVYLPYVADAHTDHKITSDAALACTKWFRHSYVKRVLAYEALSETDFGMRPEDSAFRPNVFIDITGQLEEKIRILKMYSTELGIFPFPRSEKNIRALSALRGATAGAAAAEAFMLLKETI